MLESEIAPQPPRSHRIQFDIETGTPFIEFSVANDEFGFDKPREECGIVAVSRLDLDANLATHLANGLFTIQHRGQEAAGIGIFDNESGSDLMITKGPGLVTQVLGGSNLSGLTDGKIGLGQVRYGTVGLKDASEKTKVEAAQPVSSRSEKYGDIGLVHNGNLTNLDLVCTKYNVDFNEYPTDSAALIDLIATARNDCEALPQAVHEILSQVTGAYSLVVQGEGMTIGVRDPYGYRPLMLGTFTEGGYALASESHTLQALGAYFEREVSRGEFLVVDSDGELQISYPFEKKPSRLCAFEFIYFSGPHGELDGRSVHMVRKKSGEILAQECPVDADIVIGVPDSGISASEGFSNVSGIPRSSGIVKNRYISRTFIAPDQDQRDAGVMNKFQIIPPEVYDKRVVLVDDSIVRGTTMKRLVSELKKAGAREVHLRITSAPYKWPCFFGMDTPNQNELIANRISDEHELAQYLGVDSLGYLSLGGLRQATSDSVGKLCMACMDGNYPEDPPPTAVEIRPK